MGAKGVLGQEQGLLQARICVCEVCEKFRPEFTQWAGGLLIQALA